MIDYYNHEKMISQHLAEAMKAAARERFAVEASTRFGRTALSVPGTNHEDRVRSLGKFRA